MATPFYGRGPGPQIARMDMQAATAPGRAYGQMFANLGKIAADSLDKFRANKKKKEEEDLNYKAAKGFLTQNPELALKTFNADDEDEIDAVAKGLSRSPEMGKLLSGLSSMSAQQEQIDRQDELWERKKAEHEAIKRFNQRSTGMIPNPEAEKIDAEIEQEKIGLNRVITNPPTASKSGIPAPSQEHLVAGFTARIKALEESKEGLDSQIPMMAADGPTFVYRYGTPGSWQEAQLVREDYLRRQTAQVPKGTSTVTMLGEDGKPYLYRIDSAGTPIQRIGPAPTQPSAFMSVDDQLGMSEKMGDSDANMKRLGLLDDNLRATIGTGDTARNALATLNRLPDDATTGGFSESINTIKKYLVSAGFDLPADALQDIATTEQFMQQTGEFLFKSIQQTKGSISNAEMRIFQSINPGMVQTRAGNMAMLKFIEGAGARARRKLRYKQELEGEGLPSYRRVRLLDEFDGLPENQIIHHLEGTPGLLGNPSASATPARPREGARQVQPGGGAIRTSGGGTFTPR